MVTRTSPDEGTSGRADESSTPTLVRLSPVGFERYLWFVVFLSLALDVGLTYHGLNNGFSEANPVVRLAMERVGTVGALVSLKGLALLVGFVGWGVLPSEYRGIVPLGMALPWSIAAALNLFLVISHI